MNRGSGRMVDPALSAVEPANRLHSVSGCLRGRLSGRFILVFLLVLCIALAAPLAAALPAPGEDGAGESPDENGSSEKPVTAKMPSIPEATPEPTEKPVIEKPVTFASAPEEAEPTEEVTAAPSPVVETLTAVATSASGLEGEDGVEPVENMTATAAAVSPEPTLTAIVTEEDAEDEEDEEEEEETVSPIPTLEREAPPRPGATMARAHQYYDRELPPGSHQLISPVSTYTPGATEAETPSSAAVPRDGLIVRGVGTLLDRTPEDVVLTRSGVEIANLDWLLNTAMRLGGRHPRAVLEGETFTVTVTVEARNMTLSEDDPAYVVLVPPPCETGVYEITRLGGPASLRDGERGVWEFSVATRTGRLTLADLTLPEERLVTNLTGNPDLFAFRAYAFAGGQEIPSAGLSDPVLSIRPDGEAGGVETRALPEIYAIAGIEDSMLLPSETMTGAWQRGIGYETIVAGAVGHLDAIQGLSLEELAAIHTLEEGEGGENSGGSSSSLLDLIMGFFGSLFGGLTS